MYAKDRYPKHSDSVIPYLSLNRLRFIPPTTVIHDIASVCSKQSTSDGRLQKTVAIQDGRTPALRKKQCLWQPGRQHLLDGVLTVAENIYTEDITSWVEALRRTCSLRT